MQTVLNNSGLLALGGAGLSLALRACYSHLALSPLSPPAARYSDPRASLSLPAPHWR